MTINHQIEQNMSSPEEEKRRESEKQTESDEKYVTGEEYRLTAKERSRAEMVISRVEMAISKISIEPAVILMSLGFCMFGVSDHVQFIWFNICPDIIRLRIDQNIHLIYKRRKYLIFH